MVLWRMFVITADAVVGIALTLWEVVRVMFRRFPK